MKTKYKKYTINISISDIDEWDSVVYPALKEIARGDDRTVNKTIYRAIKQFLISRGKLKSTNTRTRKRVGGDSTDS